MIVILHYTFISVTFVLIDYSTVSFEHSFILVAVHAMQSVISYVITLYIILYISILYCI